MPALAPEMLARPIAHRGLHGPGVPENSLAAVRAAVDAGYGVEIDVRPSADLVPMVFHDDFLDRMTAQAGPIFALRAGVLGGLALDGSDQTIPDLAAVRDLVDGRAPLFVETKRDPSPRLRERAGRLTEADAFCMLLEAELRADADQAAMMSFDADARAAFGRRAEPDPSRVFPLGALIDTETTLRAALEEAELGQIDFVSVEKSMLPRGEIQALRAAGRPVVAWTIRTPQEASAAAPYCDQIAFEGFAA